MIAYNCGYCNINIKKNEPHISEAHTSTYGRREIANQREQKNLEQAIKDKKNENVAKRPRAGIRNAKNGFIREAEARIVREAEARIANRIGEENMFDNF